MGIQAVALTTLTLLTGNTASIQSFYDHIRHLGWTDG